ncbi:MAG: DEAD/DEAH box helicase [Bdellovibrionaceae bacterium]|nr:DEAD/DEAH box helicase [Pseudobdellovibrionaceae bacterium]
MHFSDFNLNTNVLDALKKMQFITPTDIQSKAIPLLMQEGTDLIARAQTGTGKTAAFGIPLLHKIDPSLHSIQAVILSPTRELAAQLKEEMDKLSEFTDIKSVLVMGGTAYERQKRNIKQGKPHILIGTPGRVLDLINQRVIRLHDARYLILDEADEMLNVGFFEAVQEVIKSFEKEKQMWMFSATMPKNIVRLIKEHFNNPEMIAVDKKESTNSDIDQQYYVVRQRYFQEALSRLMQVEPKMYAMVFCKTKSDTKSLGENLISQGLKVETLHGDMAQSQRDLSMQRFKSKKVQMMICTDVAARGIDIQNLTHVINLGLPQNAESYVHRVGRTGRAGKKGIAITLLDPRDYYKVGGLERFINQKLTHSKLPTTADLKAALINKETKSLQSIIDAVQERKHAFKIDSNFQTFKQGFEELSSEEILKVAFTWFFNNQIKHLDNIGNLDATDMASHQNNTFGRMSRDRNRGGGGGGGARRYSKSGRSASSNDSNQRNKPFVHKGPFGKAKKASSDFSKSRPRSRGF